MTCTNCRTLTIKLATLYLENIIEFFEYQFDNGTTGYDYIKYHHPEFIEKLKQFFKE